MPVHLESFLIFADFWGSLLLLRMISLKAAKLKLQELEEKAAAADALNPEMPQMGMDSNE